MNKNMLGRTGMNIGAVVFGGIICMDETAQDARKYVDFAIERGVNYFDVAPSYGNAEERLGPALAPYRKDVYLACKTTERGAAGAKADLLNSLKILQSDSFDVYQLHSISTDEDVEQVFSQNGAMETFLWAKREGLVKNIGISTHSEDAALKALDLYDFDTVLFPYYFAMGLNAGWGDRIAKRVKETNAGLLAMKALIYRAWLDGEDRSAYPKSWCRPFFPDQEELAVAAMKYALSKGAATLVPPGNFEYFVFMLDHIDACAKPLTDGEWALLRAEAETVREHPIFH